MNASGIKLGLGLYTTLFIVFLYGPLAVLAILSFQTGPEGGPQFPIIEWSTYWYKHLFGLTPPSRIAPLPIEQALVRSLALAVMTMIGHFQLFAEPYVMTQGGPANATLSVVLLTYLEGFRWWNLGYAAAISFVLFAVILVLTVVATRLRALGGNLDVGGTARGGRA